MTKRWKATHASGQFAIPERKFCNQVICAQLSGKTMDESIHIDPSFGTHSLIDERICWFWKELRILLVFRCVRKYGDFEIYQKRKTSVPLQITQVSAYPTPQHDTTRRLGAILWVWLESSDSAGGAEVQPTVQWLRHTYMHTWSYVHL